MGNNHNVTDLQKLENPLNRLLKQGAQQLLAQAIEAEVRSFLNTSRQWKADCRSQ